MEQGGGCEHAPPGPRMHRSTTPQAGVRALCPPRVLFPSTLPCMASVMSNTPPPYPPPSHTLTFFTSTQPHLAPSTRVLTQTQLHQPPYSTQLQFLILLHFNHLLASSTASLIWDQLSP